MKRIKSYTNIWSIEKALYSINDLQLPFPLTFSQMAFFVISLFGVMILSDVPPLSAIDNVFIKYLAIPVGITWLMSQKTFDGKKPYRFLYSVILFLFRPKVTYAGKPVRVQRPFKFRQTVTPEEGGYHYAECISD